MTDDFLSLVFSRRSVREYSPVPIPADSYEKCVDAALFAPSACNSQPWEFIVINDTNVREQVAREVFSGRYHMNSFASKAAGYIAIVSGDTRWPVCFAGLIKNTDFLSIDTGIACAHLVLEACYLGIGTCILGWFDEKRLKKILSTPFRKRILLLIAMGYPADGTVLSEKKMKERKTALKFNHYL